VQGRSVPNSMGWLIQFESVRTISMTFWWELLIAIKLSYSRLRGIAVCSISCWVELPHYRSCCGDLAMTNRGVAIFGFRVTVSVVTKRFQQIIGDLLLVGHSWN